MTKGCAYLALALAAAFCGCTPPPAAPAKQSATKPAGWETIPATHQKLAVEGLGAVPNSGLLLPAISPDGQWIACLESRRTSADDLDLFGGRGVGGVSVTLRPLRGGQPIVVCPQGATWMAWSSDGCTLLYICYTAAGRGEIGLYDVASRRDRRLAVGLPKIAMAALSPDNRKVALIDSSRLPVRSQIYVLNLRNASLEPGPKVEGDQVKLQPLWRDSETLVYLSWQGGRCQIQQWKIGSGSETLAQLNPLENPLDLMQVYAGLSRPLNEAGSQLAFYQPLEDRLCIVKLQTHEVDKLPVGTRGGCWAGEHFAASAAKDLLLWMSSSQSCRLLSGSCLPIWSSPDGHELVIAARGESSMQFQLIRVRRLAETEQ